ncbi:MAG: hypothetical protein ACK4RZ_17035, partial [Paracoccaceae bacterium]
MRFAQGMSERAIAGSLGLGKGSVGTYLRRVARAALAWRGRCRKVWLTTALSCCCLQTQRMY